MNEHQQAAQWILEHLNDLPIKFGAANAAPVIAKWLADIANGTLVVSEQKLEAVGAEDVPPKPQVDDDAA